LARNSLNFAPHSAEKRKQEEGVNNQSRTLLAVVKLGGLTGQVLRERANTRRSVVWQEQQMPVLRIKGKKIPETWSKKRGFSGVCSPGIASPRSVIAGNTPCWGIKIRVRHGFMHNNFDKLRIKIAERSKKE